MDPVSDILSANERYAAEVDLGELALRPARRLAVVTCMDARVDALGALGLQLGDAHVIRNAGGIVTDDVLRSLALSHHVLGTTFAVVVGHTRCGLAATSNERLREIVGGAAADVDFHPFADLDEHVRKSVDTILRSPLLGEGYGAAGFVYDVTSGRLRLVA